MARKPSKTVWHVVDWERRYEPPDDLRRGRKSPLAYVKWLTGSVDAAGREAVQIATQLKALAASAGGLAHEAVWGRILRLAAGRADWRGYLLNFANAPATAAEIALMIDVPTAQVRKSLAVLERLAFLEQIDAPDLGRPPPPPSKKSRKRKRPATGRGLAPAAKRPARRQRAGAGARRAGAGARRASAGARGATGNGKQEPERKQEPEPKREQKRKPSHSASGNGLTPSPQQETAEQEHRREPTHSNGRPAPPARNPGRPAEADQPTKADPGPEAPQGPAARASPPGSDNLHIVPTPEAFGQRVFMAIYVTTEAAHRWWLQSRNLGGADPPADLQGFVVRETACFAAGWEAALSLGLDAQELLILHGRSAKEAEAISRKRTRFKRTPGAAWRYWFNKHMAALVGEGKWKKANDGTAAKRKVS